MNVQDEAVVGTANADRELSQLRIELAAEGFPFTRFARPQGAATIAEIVAALNHEMNKDFFDPEVNAGEITIEEGGRIVLLARYFRAHMDEGPPPVKIVEIVAEYFDGVDENIPVPVPVPAD